MHFTTTSLLLFAPLALGGSLIDRKTYERYIAPIQFARLDEYRDKSSTTVAQLDVLNRAVAVVAFGNITRLPGLRASCDAAYGEDECARVLTGQSLSEVAAAKPHISTRNPLSRRALDCECTDEASRYCGGGWHCADRAENCEMNLGMVGCGDLWLYVCSGLCVREVRCPPLRSIISDAYSIILGLRVAG